MALSDVQFKVLFIGSFGQALADLGFELDTSGPDPVAKKGSQVVSLLVVENRAIEWQINGEKLVKFTPNGKDEKSQRRKSDALTALTAAIR